MARVPGQEAVRMRPDLVVSRDGTHALVADCKYKRLNTGEHKHHDLYQLLAYCTALELRDGVLIYPRHLVDVATMVTVRGTDVRLREELVDLGGSPGEVMNELDRLADRIRCWAASSAQSRPLTSESVMLEG